MNYPKFDITKLAGFTKKGTNEINVSPWIGDKVQPVIINENLHILSTNNLMPPYEQLAQMLLTHGDKTENGKLINSEGVFGYDPRNPIPAKTIYNEIRLISNLRFENGEKPNVERMGCALSPVSNYVVNCYRLNSIECGKEIYIYIDPYADDTTTEAPEGLNLLQTLD